MNSAVQDTVYSVSAITDLLKNMIEGTFPSVVIEGEISNYRPNASGHVYFTLKDNRAQLSAVMFRSRAAGLTFIPADGMLVQCRGQLSVYAPRGNYQIIINSMQIAGTGNILQMLDERKKRLAAEGLFDNSRKKRLPVYPDTIGIITSSTGAALRDILQITKRRNNSVSVVILPALVQGDGAAETIIRQIKTANAFRLCDVLIVGRGGGSLEDLLPFSEENVVRAISESEIPVVSAVGHEIDWALSDFVADERAPTPSAAAELVVPLKSEVLEYLHRTIQDFHDTIERRIENTKLMVKTFNPDNLELQFRTIEQPLLARFDQAKTALLENMLTRLKDTRQNIQNCIQILESSSPETILARGYAMVRDKTTHKILRSGKDTRTGAEIEIIPARGKITAIVQTIDYNTAPEEHS